MRKIRAGVIGAALATATGLALGQDTADCQKMIAEHKVLIDTLWVMVAAFLVFWMQA